MGLGGISVWQLIIVLVIVLLVFGTRKLRGMGSDLGGAVKGFKDAMSDDEKPAETASTQEQVIEPEQTTTANTETKKEETPSS